MVISGLLLLVLLWHFYLGYSRGIVKQGYNLLATLLSLVFASMNYQTLADRLTLWVPYSQPLDESVLPLFAGVNIFEMDRVFYGGLGFLLAFLGAYLVFAFLSIFLHFLPLERLDKRSLNLLSGGLSVLVTLIFFSLFGNLVATIPWERLQVILSGNALVKGIISYFPILSPLLKYLWVTRILG